MVTKLALLRHDQESIFEEENETINLQEKIIKNNLEVRVICYRYYDEQRGKINTVSIRDVINDRRIQLSHENLVQQKHILKAMPGEEAFLLGYIIGQDSRIGFHREFSYSKSNK